MKKYALQATVVTFLLSALVVIIHSLGLIDESIMLVLIGIFGFGSVAELRLFIEQRGWKTYVFAIGGALGVIALILEWATPEQVGYWYGFWGIATFGGLTHAVYKLKML
jgi:hypothetical protein